MIFLSFNVVFVFFSSFLSLVVRLVTLCFVLLCLFFRYFGFQSIDSSTYFNYLKVGVTSPFFSLCLYVLNGYSP